MASLTHKVVVITGGADGIGYAIADKYLEQGAKVIILLDINEKKGNEAAKEFNSKYGENKAVFIKCDVTSDLTDVSKIIFDNYKVDILVNSAGLFNDAEIKRTIDINVTAVTEWGLTFWDHMRKDQKGNGGTIINLASIYGYEINPFLPVYTTSKFAVIGFTKALGHPIHFARSGVRVVAICPGFTETKMTAEPTLRDMGQIEEFDEFLKIQIWQKPDAVGDAAVKIFQQAESGSAWLIEGSKPVVQVAF